MTQPQVNLIFRSKAGKHNSLVIRALAGGSKTAYDLYRMNEEALQYSTSNRRLRSLENGGYVTREARELGQGRSGRGKIHYNLSFKGSLAALLLQPPLSEKEFVTLVGSCQAVNHAYELFGNLLNLGVSAKSIWENFGEQLKRAIENGRINLNAEDKTLEVFVAFELVRSIGKPTREHPEKRKEIVEAVYDFVGSCPFENFFGDMTVVMLGAIAQRYLKTNRAFHRIYTRVNGDIRFTFNPLNDEDAVKVLPFLDPTYSRIANETWRVFSELSSFVYTMYDEYGET
jgi:DNA-binding HxlR family transcriptional regulator